MLLLLLPSKESFILFCKTITGRILISFCPITVNVVIFGVGCRGKSPTAVRSSNISSYSKFYLTSEGTLGHAVLRSLRKEVVVVEFVHKGGTIKGQCTSIPICFRV